MKTTATKYLLIFLFTVFILPVYRCSSAVVSELTAREYAADQDLLHFVKQGSGPDVVLFLHGLAGTASYFSNRFGEVPESKTFYAIDLLGFGESPKPKGSYDLAMHRQAIEHLISTVITPTNPRSMQIVAHSMGTLIALDLVKQQPDSFRKVTLIGTPIYRTKEEARVKIGAAGIMYRGMADDDLLMTASCFFRDSYRIAWMARLFNLPEDVYLGGTQHSWTSLHGSLHQTIMSFKPENYEDLDGKTFQFFHAENDEVAPFARARDFAARIGANFDGQPTGGHHIFLTATDQIMASIRDLPNN